VCSRAATAQVAVLQIALCVFQVGFDLVWITTVYTTGLDEGIRTRCARPPPRCT
jgi:hypothetical protein